MTETMAPLDMAQANEMLREVTATGRIGWAVDNFGHGAVLLSSMQKSASVLMHHFYHMGLGNEILFVDTGYHFHETLRLRDEFIQRFGLTVVTLYPELTPEQQEGTYGKKLHLYVDGQKVCCHNRKTFPYIDHVLRLGHKLSMVGVRRNERGRRDGLDILVRDPRTQGYVLHPIYDWTSERIDSYLAEHDVPVNPLHDQGYPSIGCACCTTPVEPWEDPRAGRWRHLRETGGDGPQYCGIILTDGAGI